MTTEEGRELLERLNGEPSAKPLVDRDVFFLPTRAGSVVSIDLLGPTASRDSLITDYWRFHPRFEFLKTLTLGAHVLDLGAGSGGLIHWRSWGTPDRSDLCMYAVDIREGEFFGQYVDFDLVDLSIDQVKYPGGCFDAAICSHVIDHLDDGAALVAEIARIVRPGAKVYIEWLNSDTQSGVTRSDLAVYGVVAGTMQFGDDAKHRRSVTNSDLLKQLNGVGFDVIRGGIIANDFIYPQLLRYGFMHSDMELTTLGLWLALSSVRYFVLEKC